MTGFSPARNNSYAATIPARPAPTIATRVPSSGPGTIAMGFSSERMAVKSYRLSTIGQASKSGAVGFRSCRPARSRGGVTDNGGLSLRNGGARGTSFVPIGSPPQDQQLPAALQHPDRVLDADGRRRRRVGAQSTGR